jgi:hypothetical protein
VAGERDKYGVLVDPGEQYQEFMLGLYDTEALASELGYSVAALALLHQARLKFLEEFEAKHPGYGLGRAIWK